MNEKKCAKCNQMKSIDQFYARNRNGKVKGTHSYCKQCMKETVMEHRRSMKERAIQYAGGRCTRCGYDSCT